MTVAEFLTWASAQPRGRYELVRGEVVAMAPERALHNLVKAAVFVALKGAVERAGLPCTGFTDGMTVVIDAEHAREPDAAVQCYVATDLDSMVLEAPVIVVEITSPSFGARRHRREAGRVFPVPSIRHYLIVNPAKKVVHPSRAQPGGRCRDALRKLRGDRSDAARHRSPGPGLVAGALTISRTSRLG